jgi:hypothetical protein
MLVFFAIAALSVFQLGLCFLCLHLQQARAL